MSESKSRQTNADTAIAGGVSGFLTRLICQPLDVIKIRFQLQVEPISHYKSSKYRSLAQATSAIVYEEGVSALWKGHVPAQLLSISYGVVQFYSYNKIVNSTVNRKSLDRHPHSINFLAGASAGCIATIISFPFDTARTKLVAQSSNNQVYKGLLSFYASMWRTESSKSLFRGLSPTLIQIAPLTGLQFVFYNIFTDVYKELLSNDVKISATNSAIAGSLSGVLAKTAVYPFDLARKRLQIQGFQHGRQGFGKFFNCKGLFDCLIQTFKGEGIRGLFKGLLPSQLKAAATTALHFTFYEQTLHLLKTINW